MTTGPSPSADTLRKLHSARAHSAYERAVAACRHAGIDAELGLSAQSLTALADTAPDPAADARCARNAAATAALAAQVAGSLDDRAETATALRAALAASQAAATAAGGTAAGQDTTLNAKADDTEERAVAAARTAGWM
jgi:hypothetical protein